MVNILCAYAQPGVYNKPVYNGEYTVVDCFKNARFSGKFKADTIKANYVMKGEKVWRKINLTDKENFLVFNTNGRCKEITLFEIIKFGILEKNLRLFSSDDFNNVKQTLLTKEQFLKLILITDTAVNKVFDAEGNESSETVISNGYMNGTDVKSYMLKENWIINSYTGEQEKRIIGIAPLVYDPVQQKVVPLFWIYYQEWRELFASFEARNFKSEDKISFEDVFTKRYFNSLISKENNVFNRSLNSVHKGDGFYVENEQLKEKMNKTEEDLFQK